MKTLTFLVFLIISFSASTASLVGGEVAIQAAATATSTTVGANMDDGTLIITLNAIEGTDVEGNVTIPSPVPNGSVVCMKANGRQSSDWSAGKTLGNIATTAETCSWGHGTVRNGRVTLTVANACPAGRTDAVAIMSGIVQLPDGTQAWVPHPASYRVLNAEGMDATAIAFNCTANRVESLDSGQAEALANLF